VWAAEAKSPSVFSCQIARPIPPANACRPWSTAKTALRLRGPGELLGLKQHGLPGFKLADFVKDRSLVEISYEDARTGGDLTEAAVQAIRHRFEEGVIVFPN